MIFFSKMRKSTKYFLISLAVLSPFAVSQLSQASSSQNIMEFVEETPADLAQDQMVVMNAIRGNLVQSFTTIITSPTTVSQTMAQILWSTDAADSGGASMDAVAEFIKIGGE